MFPAPLGNWIYLSQKFTVIQPSTGVCVGVGVGDARPFDAWNNYIREQRLISKWQNV